jgi:cell division protein FtsB
MPSSIVLEERRIAPIYQVLFATCLILLVGVIVKLYMDGHQEISRLEDRRAAEQRHLTEAKATVVRLDGEIQLLKTDEGVEIAARDKLRFIRPDEVVIITPR